MRLNSNFTVFPLISVIRFWLDEDVRLTIKPLKAFFSLMRYRPSADVILMCLISMLNLKGQKEITVKEVI